MKFWKEYVEYLKDNPEGYWFKRKMYGYGWTPAKPAGWFVVFAYIALVLGGVIYLESHIDGAEDPRLFIALVVVASILLLVITWRTGEPIKWQWGSKKDKHKSLNETNLK